MIKEDLKVILGLLFAGIFLAGMIWVKNHQANLLVNELHISKKAAWALVIR